MSDEQEMITGIDVPIVHKYNFTAGAATARFSFSGKEGRSYRPALSQLQQCVLSSQRIVRYLRCGYRG